MTAVRRLVVTGADVGGGRSVDVLLVDGAIAAVEPAGRLDREAVGDVDDVNARGGALLPGLHDHHLHLFALGAALRSVVCGPPAVTGWADLLRRIRDAADGRTPGGWVRGVGYHESVAGPLDRWVLDRIEAGRPVRIQHRSGGLWMVNSAGADALDLTSSPDAGVERGPDGQPTGRLWRMDAWLRDRIGTDPVDLAEVGGRLAGYGITGVTDATPDLDDSARAELAAATEDGRLPLDVLALGVPLGTPAPGPVRVRVGPYKILLPDHELPGFDQLGERIRAAHGAGRGVAVHCVTRASLVLALAALDEVGAVAGDRIEHGAVMPPELVAECKRLGLRVVTQPGFVAERGDTYLDEVEPDDRDHLHPYASLLAAGVPSAPSSDAPFGDPDPWAIIRAARDRRTRDGRVVGGAERVDPATTLAGFLSPLDDPGGRVPRRVAVGAPADLCLLHVPLARALAAPSSEHVRLTIKAGVPHRGVTRVSYSDGYG